MLKENAITLCNTLGKVTEADCAGNDNSILEKYLRLKVEIDVNTNIISYSFHIKNDNSFILIQFRFERIPDFFFNCGSFIHKELMCAGNLKEFMFEGNHKVLALGNWVKASLNKDSPSI